MPVAHRVEHGNTEDSSTHVSTWDSLRALHGRSDFLYVADSKLATRKNMDHIASLGGRFLSVLPATRKEDRATRDWLVTHEANWTEALRRTGRYVDEPPSLYETAPAPWPTPEGYRVVWGRSSAKLERDAETRRARISAGIAAIDELNQRLLSPKNRLKDVVGSRPPLGPPSRPLPPRAG